MSICAIARPSRPARKRYANIMAPLTLLPLACLPATGTLARENTTPTGDEITARTELGRRLFYDIRLAGPGYMSCASCHKPEKTFTDGRPVAIGVTGERHTRNTPTLANVPDLPILGWANPSPQSFEHRMLRPLFSQTPIEMGTRDYEQPVLLHISSNAIYRELFARAFHNDPAPVSFGNITRAIADFQRTIISRDSPYDRYAAGDRDALSPAAALLYSAAHARNVASAMYLRCSRMRGFTTPASTIVTARADFPARIKASRTRPTSTRTSAGSERQHCATSP